MILKLLVSSLSTSEVKGQPEIDSSCRQDELTHLLDNPQGHAPSRRRTFIIVDPPKDGSFNDFRRVNRKVRKSKARSPIHALATPEEQKGVTRGRSTGTKEAYDGRYGA